MSQTPHYIRAAVSRAAIGLQGPAATVAAVGASVSQRQTTTARGLQVEIAKQDISHAYTDGTTTRVRVGGQDDGGYGMKTWRADGTEVFNLTDLDDWHVINTVGEPQFISPTQTSDPGTDAGPPSYFKDAQKFVHLRGGIRFNYPSSSGYGGPVFTQFWSFFLGWDEYAPAYAHTSVIEVTQYDWNGVGTIGAFLGVNYATLRIDTNGIVQAYWTPMAAFATHTVGFFRISNTIYRTV